MRITDPIAIDREHVHGRIGEQPLCLEVDASFGCAGAIEELDHVVFEPLVFAMVA